MTINLSNNEELPNLNNFTDTLRIMVNDASSENYYKEWEHRTSYKYLLEYELVKGEVNSQRYARYDRDGGFIDCFSLN